VSGNLELDGLSDSICWQVSYYKGLQSRLVINISRMNLNKCTIITIVSKNRVSSEETATIVRGCSPENLYGCLSDLASGRAIKAGWGCACEDCSKV